MHFWLVFEGTSSNAIMRCVCSNYVWSWHGRWSWIECDGGRSSCHFQIQFISCYANWELRNYTWLLSRFSFEENSANETTKTYFSSLGSFHREDNLYSKMNTSHFLLWKENAMWCAVYCEKFNDCKIKGTVYAACIYFISVDGFGIKIWQKLFKY